MALEAGLILLAVFVILLVLSVPIAVSIAIASMVTINPVAVGYGFVYSRAKLVTGIDNFSLLAVPFFILAGILMTNGGIAERLVNFAKILVGRAPGALAHTNIVGNMLFGSIAGSSVASAVAIGGVMGRCRKRKGMTRNSQRRPILPQHRPV